MSLTKEQIQKVDNYLKQRGIEFWDVRYEFADHIACILEEKMNQDMTFELAFKEVEQGFPRKVLQKQQKTIQKNLNKLIFKTYLNELKDAFVKPFKLLSIIGLILIMTLLLNSDWSSYGFIVGFSLSIVFIIIVLFSIFMNYKFHGKSMLLSLSCSNAIFVTIIPQIINYFFGGKEVVMKEYPLVFISSIVVTYILALSWYNGYTKLVNKQKVYYDLINA